MIFYEAPHKLPATLRDMLEAFGNRNIALVRELTKLHEEVIHTTLLEAAEMYNDENKPRGEFVIIVDGYTPDENEEAFTLEQAVELARSYMAEGQSASSAAKQASADTGHKKGDIYKILCK
jgi:16S rRNA (cytidine1402-2'-O)-methyltransferase